MTPRDRGKKKGIIFDLDGTLTDTLKDVAVCMNDILSRHGLPQFPEGAYKQFIGGGLNALIEAVVPKELQSEKYNNLLADEFFEKYSANATVYTKLYPEIPEMLGRLDELSVPKGILSNKLHSIVLEICKKLLSPWSFQSIWGVKNGYPKKPDPTSALEIARELDVDRKNILFLGDSGSDMETAVRAGMIPVGVLWGFRDEEELVQSGAKRIISRPLELLDTLAG
jgi:phosphoglycolate phosphatase